MNYLQIIFNCIVVMHRGTALLKLKSTFILALMASPLAFISEGVASWMRLNIEFIGFVFGAVVLDHIIGSYVHGFIKKDFCVKLNIRGFLMKTALIISVFFLGRGIVSILGADNSVAIYFRTIMRLMVFLYPAGSALMNCSIITNGKFPPIGFVKKINSFNSELNVEHFKGVDNNN
jgi:hypothetical protein